MYKGIIWSCENLKTYALLDLMCIVFVCVCVCACVF